MNSLTVTLSPRPTTPASNPPTTTDPNNPWIKFPRTTGNNTALNNNQDVWVQFNSPNDLTLTNNANGIATFTMSPGVIRPMSQSVTAFPPGLFVGRTFTLNLPPGYYNPSTNVLTVQETDVHPILDPLPSTTVITPGAPQTIVYHNHYY